MTSEEETIKRLWEEHQVILPKFKIHEVFNTSSVKIEARKESAGWAEALMRLPELWARSEGSGVVVSVLDTGCDLNHPDLKGAVRASKSFIRGESVEDLNNHGTACAGIIGARRDGKGIVGIAPKCELLVGKTLSNEGSGPLSALAHGIEWSVSEGADIISMSLGSDMDSPELHGIVHEALAKGVILIAAAGNSGAYGRNTISYPARYGSVISVGAHDRDGNVSGFSSRGGEVNFIAPGEEILSTAKKGQYARMSGTSFATPIVSGLAALILAKHRKAEGGVRGIFRDRAASTKTAINNNNDMFMHLLSIASSPGHYDPARGYGVLLPFEYRRKK